MSIDNIFSRKFITVISGIVISVYIAGIFLLKGAYQCTFNDVLIFNADHWTVVSIIISFFVFFSGFLLLFIIPGWAFSLHVQRLKRNISVFLGFSFFLSLMGLVLTSTLYKMIWRLPLDRVNIFGMIGFITLIGVASLWCRSSESFKMNNVVGLDLRRTISYITLILVSIIFMVIFRDMILMARPVNFDYSQQAILSIPLGYQADDLEVFGVANSLRQHLLPYWDLEYANRFGFVFTDPPLYSFVSIFSILLFGESKTSLALVSMGFATIIFLIILAQRQKKKFVHLSICSILLVAYFYFFLRDATVFIYPGHFFIFLIVVSFYYLLRGNNGMFILFALLTTLTRYYGILFMSLGIIALALFFKEKRHECGGLFVKYGYVLIGLAGGIIFIGMGTGNLAIYWETFFVENFMRFDYFNLLNKYFPGSIVNNLIFNLDGSLQFVLWCLYSTAFVFPVVCFFQKNKEENYYSFIALVYFILVFFSQYQLRRYTIPIIPFSAIVLSSQLERWMSSGRTNEDPNLNEKE